LRVLHGLGKLCNSITERVDPCAQIINLLATGHADALEEVVHLFAHSFFNGLDRRLAVLQLLHLLRRGLPALALGLLPRLALLHERVEHLRAGLLGHGKDPESGPPRGACAANCP